MGAPPQFAYPDQVPRFDIPGAEYFALAPGAHIANSGMRRINAASTPATSVPASGQFTLTFSQLIESPWSSGAGIYIRLLNGIFIPADATGHLQLTAIRLAVAGTSTFADYDIGAPYATLTTPSATIIAIQARDLMVTQHDLTIMGPFTGQLFFTVVLAVTNTDGAAAHSFQAALKGAWARLDGFTE